MRRMNKELKRVNREIRHLEDCVCSPLCMEAGIIPPQGNGCRTKVECDHLRQYLANDKQKVFLLMDKRSYLEHTRDTMSLYS